MIRRSFLAGSLVGLAGASVLNAQNRAIAPSSLFAPSADGALSVLDFIPAALHPSIRDRTCQTDLAEFVGQAIRAVLRQPGGGTVFFPAGAYPVTSIDAANGDAAQFSTALILAGQGRYASVIRSIAPGRILLDAAGRNNMTVQSLQFESAGHASVAALRLCRTQASPNCNNNRFFDVLFSGNYTQASVLSVGAESTSWLACRFENASTAANHRCFATGSEPDGLIPRVSGLPLAIAGPNTDNVMNDCEFYAPFARSHPVLFDGGAGYAMIGCSVIAGDSASARLVTYRPRKDIFNGGVTWTASHFEVFGQGNIVHFLDAPAGVSYFRSINSLAGNYVVSSATLLLGQGAGRKGAQPVLMASSWTVPNVPWGVRDLRFEVFGLTESSIDFKLGDGVGDVTVSGFASSSRIMAAKKAIAQTVDDAG